MSSDKNSTKCNPTPAKEVLSDCERRTLRLCIPITMNSHWDYPHRIQEVSSALGAHRPSPSYSHLFSNSLFPSHSRTTLILLLLFPPTPRPTNILVPFPREICVNLTHFLCPPHQTFPLYLTSLGLCVVT